MQNLNPEDYKKLGSRQFSKVHHITSYFAMFPPSLPYYFIKNLTQVGDLVFDPFSGRGTSVFEACRLGRLGVGNDLSSLAYFLTSSKVSLPTHKKSILKRLEEIRASWHPQDIDTTDVEDTIKMIFEESLTLTGLIHLKNSLKPLSNEIDRFLLALTSGIMHGKYRKDGSSQYLSISMPNTFSMSPNYLRNYIHTNQLKKLKQNVFDLIENKIHSIFPLDLLSENGATDLNSLKDYVRGKALI